MVASLKKSSRCNSGAHKLLAAATLPVFDFGAFFHGHTRASGWFADRFGTPRRHFCGDFFGYYKEDQFILDENLYYTDGVIEERLWRVTLSEDGVFSAQSDSLTTEATGLVRGNTLSMRYSMKVAIADNRHWDLDMRDTMMLQPDGSLHNINHVYKWGIRIGTVSAQYVHHDGDRLCVPIDDNSDTAGTHIGAEQLPDVSDRLLSAIKN